jgi:hypothetical protein
MKLPSSVKIAGQRIKIKICKLEGCYGQYEHESHNIFISDEIKDDKIIIATLRHEMMEASLLLSGVAWCEKMETEAVIRCMEEIFFPSWELLKL